MLLLSPLVSKRGRRVTDPTPASPHTRVGWNRACGYYQQKKRESSRKGRKWEEQIIYIKKVT